MDEYPLPAYNALRERLLVEICVQHAIPADLTEGLLLYGMRVACRISVLQAYLR